MPARVRLLVAAAALVLTALSGLIQRHGPDQAVFCAPGTSSDGTEIYCPRPVLNGGWPAPFVFDSAGISVEDRIGVEDDFRPWPFLANMAFYGVVIGTLVRVLTRFRK